MATSVQNYNIVSIKKNTKKSPVQFILKDGDNDPISLSGAAISIAFRLGSYDGVLAATWTTANSKVTITDAANGTFQTAEQTVNWTAGVYYYDVKITFADGDIKTWIEGTFEILESANT